MSLVTIVNGRLTVIVSTLGAELQSIKDHNGIERLWQGDPAYWAGRAPILFPIAGGLRNDCYTMDSRRYDMPKHGYVRNAEWRIEEANENSATLLFTDKHPGFPFNYELRARYALVGSALQVEYAVANTGEQAFWYGLGAHEGYAVPEGLDTYEIVFDREERLENYLLQGNLITREPVLIADHTRSLHLSYDYFMVDAMVFLTLKSRGVTLKSRLHDRTVRVDFPGHDVLMLWSRPAAGYICIEPWLNGPDYVDHDGQIEHKPGCVYLRVGEAKSHKHIITFG